jgi:hypothetical protein
MRKPVSPRDRPISKGFDTQPVTQAPERTCEVDRLGTVVEDAGHLVASDGTQRETPPATRGPERAFRLQNVVPSMPCRRQTSSVLALASCSRRIAMIGSSLSHSCASSVCPLTDSALKRGSARGAGHGAHAEACRLHERSLPGSVGGRHSQGVPVKAGRPIIRRPVASDGGHLIQQWSHHGARNNDPSRVR